MPSHRVERRRAQFRPIGFRCFSPFGRRGKEPPDRADVSFSPSKIPYGGFSPVRLQTGLQRRRPSSTAPALSAEPAYVLAPPAYTPPPALHRTPVALAGMYGGAISRDVSSPEALGSPAGYVVPPVPADLCIRRRASALRSCPGCPREGPPFTLPICSLRAAFPYPGGLKRLLLTVASSLPLAFATVALARRPPRTSMVLRPGS